jgi:hypothetical protein
MPNAFEVLAKDHEEVKLMLAELERGPSAAAEAGSDQLALRKKMVQQLVIEESRHEAVEEMYFWPAVRDALTDGDALADRAPASAHSAVAGAAEEGGPAVAAADRVRDAVTGRDE